MAVSFEQTVIFLRDHVLARLFADLGRQVPVVEVVFFPDMKHAPMARIDGSALNEKQAAALEAASLFAMVRMPNLAFAITPEQFARISEQFPPSSTTVDGQTSEDDINELVRAYLRDHSAEIQEWVLWEIEIDDRDSIVIRLLPKKQSHGKKPPLQFGVVRVEFVSEGIAADGEALLRAFDAAKQERILFLRYLRNILGHEL